jgi:hypothetical protein
MRIRIGYDISYRHTQEAPIIQLAPQALFFFRIMCGNIPVSRKYVLISGGHRPCDALNSAASNADQLGRLEHPWTVPSSECSTGAHAACGCQKHRSASPPGRVAYYRATRFLTGDCAAAHPVANDRYGCVRSFAR